LHQHLSDARDQLAELWREGEIPRTEAQAVESLRPLFVRTLPSLEEPPQADDPVATPLQRTFGSILEHHLLWFALVRLIGQQSEAARRILAGDGPTVLQELCHLLVLLMLPQPEREAEPALPVPAHLSISPGISMVEADLMGYHHLRLQGALQQAQREQQLQRWVEEALDEEPLTRAPRGLLLRFWRLLQGDSSLWAQVLGTRLREALADDPSAEAVRGPLAPRVEHLQGLLREQPQARLGALLAQVQARVQARLAEHSPLAGPLSRLLRLVRGEWEEEVARGLTRLQQEIAPRSDWPLERRRDLLWLLALGHTLLRPLAETRLQATLDRLRQTWEEEA